MANKQIVNFNASTQKPSEGSGVKGTLYFITGEETAYLCTDPSTLVPMDGSVKNISIDVSTKQMSVNMIGDTSLNTDFITGDDILGEDMTAREELVKSVNDVLKILTGSGDIPYFNENLDYYKDDFVIYNGVSYKFIYNHAASAWTGNDVEQTSLMAAYKELLAMVKTYTGVEELPEFSDTVSYSVNSIVVYNGVLYKFTSAHSAGPWNPLEVEPTSLVKEYLVMADSTDKETVQIHVTKQDTLTTKTNYAAELSLSVDGASETLTADENGNASVVIDDGKTYTISCSPVEGYSVPASITRVAQLNNYFISFNYLNNSLAPMEYEYPYCHIFSTDFSLTDPDLWAQSGYNKVPVGVVLNTPLLQKYNLKFLIRFEDIVKYNENTGQYVKSIVTKQWQSGSGELNHDYVPTTTTNSVAQNMTQYELVTPNIIDRAANQFGQTAPAAAHANNQVLIINDVSYGKGYLPSGLQMMQLLLNEGLISNCVRKVYGINISFTDNNPRLWTNVQYNATNAWYTNGASLGGGYFKTYSFGVVPFFAVPSGS